MQKTKSHRRWKRVVLPFVLFVMMLVPFASVLAESVSDNNITVEANETLEKTSFLSGNNIRVDGNINATTFAVGNNVEINGEIDGDLFVAAQSVVINGNVKGSIFTASQNVSVANSVENNIYSAGQTVNIKSEIDGSAFLAGQNINVADKARVKKDVFIGGATILQNGVINGDLTSSSESLVINGKINGDLNYRSKKEADVANDARISGQTHWSEVNDEPKQEKSFFPSFWSILYSVLAAFIVWLIIRLIRPTFWGKLADKILNKPLKTFGIGILGVIFIPFIGLILLITIIGIPLSLILLTLYAISLYVSKIILSVFIAYWFQKRFTWTNAQAFWMILLSLIILSIISAIPFLGWLVRFLIVSFGLGSIIYSFKKAPAHLPVQHQQS